MVRFLDLATQRLLRLHYKRAHARDSFLVTCEIEVEGSKKQLTDALLGRLELLGDFDPGTYCVTIEKIE